MIREAVGRLGRAAGVIGFALLLLGVLSVGGTALMIVARGSWDTALFASVAGLACRSLLQLYAGLLVGAFIVTGFRTWLFFSRRKRAIENRTWRTYRV